MLCVFLFTVSSSVTDVLILNRLLNSIIVLCIIRTNSIANQCVVMAVSDSGRKKTGIVGQTCAHTYIHTYVHT